MITAITAKKNEKSANLDDRFGRCPFFAIYNHSNNEIEFIENPYKNEQGGVGTRVVELLANKDVTQVVAAEFGPKASGLLEKLKIQMIVPDKTGETVADIISKIN